MRSKREAAGSQGFIVFVIVYRREILSGISQILIVRRNMIRYLIILKRYAVSTGFLPVMRYIPDNILWFLIIPRNI